MNTRRLGIFFLLAALILGWLFAPLQATAQKIDDTFWWDVETEDEVPSTQYDSILYSEIAPRLHEIELNSNRVMVEVIGQSAGGRDMYLVTLSDPKALGRLGQYQAIRRTMLTDPAKAQDMIEKFGDFKVPVFINASIHGNEYPGVDAAIRLIETLAYENTPEVQSILENVILLVNVVANPDGRVAGTRSNSNGFDLNRDFITQSQPETRAMVKLISEWNPMVTLDLHGFVNPMLIEPCTPPHNPNYEYDLYIQWAYYEALAMEAELYAQTGFLAQIPFLDDALGWDDWPPSYTPMYAMFHGSYGHTLETPYRDERGIDAHFAAVWGALKFVVANRPAMIYDQIEIFRRGFLDLPQILIPDELLEETQFDQYNELMIKDFPAAYIIPADAPRQVSDHPVARLVDFLLFNDTQVEQAVRPFSVDGIEYPAGTYIVWMNQPKRGLANTILEAGIDLSNIPGLTFYSPPSVWSNSLLWGVEAIAVEEFFSAETIAIKQAAEPAGEITGSGAAYAFRPTSIAAVQAVNALLAAGQPVSRLDEPLSSQGVLLEPGSFVIEPDSQMVNSLVNQYAIDLVALASFPLETTLLSKPALAVSADAGTIHALQTLGFDFDVITAQDFNSGAITGYNFYLNLSQPWAGLSQPGRTALTQFFAAGGDYLGLGVTGSDFALRAGVIDLSLNTGSGNAIVRVNYLTGDYANAGYPTLDFAFVNSPLWFSDLAEGIQTSASMAGADFLVSGYWPGWDASGAGGMPVIVHTPYELVNDIALIGLDVTFRGHPENTFRLLGNLIFAGSE